MQNFPEVDAYGELVCLRSGTNYSGMLSACPPGHALLIVEAPNAPSYWSYSECCWIEKPPRPTDAHDWDAVAKAWVDRRSVAEVIADRWSVVRDARDRMDRSPIAVDGRTFDATPQSQIEIRLRALEASAAMVSGDASWSVTWTLADNTDAVLTAQQMIAVADALQDRRNSIRTSASAFRAAIQQATTLQAVLSVPDPL